jgi:aspartate kinase
VEWARRAGIAIYARSTFGPRGADGEPERETIVRKSAPSEDNRVRAVVGEAKAALVRLASDTPIDLAQACDALAGADVPMRDFTLAERGGSFVVPLANVPDWERVRAKLGVIEPWSRARIETGVGVVSVVGHGLSETTEPLRRMLATLREARVIPMEVRASPLRLRATLAGRDAADAQRALHAAFVEQD